MVGNVGQKACSWGGGGRSGEIDGICSGKTTGGSNMRGDKDGEVLVVGMSEQGQMG